MSEEEVHEAFVSQRWGWNAGKPACPRCGVDAPYWLHRRRRWTCKGCHHQFSVTSGTIFASRKLSLRDCLLATVLFADASKGISSLSRNLSCTPKTAFVLLHKLREALARSLDQLILSGVVEIDGCIIGGYRKVRNSVGKGFTKRTYSKHFDNRRVVTVMRQRLGRTIPFVGHREMDALDEIKKRLDPHSIIQADQSRAWNSLGKLFDLIRINHKMSFAANGACTNMAESYFALLRRMQMGTHHKLSGDLLQNYASEVAWKQDHRSLSAPEKSALILSLALEAPQSLRWAKYWQRHKFFGENDTAALAFAEAAE